MEVQPAQHLRHIVRQRTAFVLENGYRLLKAKGVWEHASGDQIPNEKLLVAREREWCDLREWIVRQASL